MILVRGIEIIDGLPVLMGDGSLEDSVAAQFKVGAIIDQTRVLPGVSQIGDHIPVTDTIIVTKKYRVLNVQERKSEIGTKILDVTMKEI